MSDKTASVHWEGRGKQGVAESALRPIAESILRLRSRFEETFAGRIPRNCSAPARRLLHHGVLVCCDAAGLPLPPSISGCVRLVMKDGGFSIDRISLKLEANGRAWMRRHFRSWRRRENRIARIEALPAVARSP